MSHLPQRASSSNRPRCGGRCIGGLGEQLPIICTGAAGWWWLQQRCWAKDGDMAREKGSGEGRISRVLFTNLIGFSGKALLGNSHFISSFMCIAAC